MFIRLFRLSQPLPALVLVGLISACACLSYYKTFVTVPDNGMPFYEIAWQMFAGFPTWVRVLVCTTLVYTQAIHLNLILNRHEVLYKDSWLPALCYLLIAGLLPQFMWFHPLLFVNSLLLFALDKIFYLYKNENPLSLDFDIGFIIGLAVLFYIPVVIYVLFFGAALILLRPFSLRDWASGIIGCILPLFFAFSYYLLTDKLMLLYERIVLSGINKPMQLTDFFPREYSISLIFIAIVIALALIRQQANFYKNVAKTRLNQLVIYLMVVTGILVAAFTETPMIYRFYTLCIPLSIWLAYYFLSAKRALLSEIVFLGLVAVYIYNYTVK